MIVVLVELPDLRRRGQLWGLRRLLPRARWLRSDGARDRQHLFGLLADEYPYDGGTQYAEGEPTQPNITTQTARSSVKWGDWIAPATQSPTTLFSPDVPGLYEGAHHYERGIYRPTYDSKMRSLNRPFDRVNSALLIDRIFDFANVDATPPSGSIAKRAHGQQWRGSARPELHR